MIDQKGPENLEYLKYLDSMIQGDARCVTGIISRFAKAKAAFNKKISLQIELKEKKNCELLGYYAASSGNVLPAFRDNLSDSSLEVKILYR
jgi:hypothetical protein